jgi:UDP-N-acetylglucosamine transferase subunit ALG13
MIFVVLGTWEMPFSRPLHEIEAAVGQGLVTEPVLVQSGSTHYTSKHMRLVPFFGKQELEQMYDKASLVICQAGVGSIMLGLKKQKKVISIARLARYDEHIDDHQLEILNVFTQTRAVLTWRGEGDLPEVLRRAEAFEPSAYKFAKERISGAILEYLDDSLNSRLGT